MAAKTAARLLLVEDDPASQSLVQALCEAGGYSVDTASDGFLGLRLLSERRHDVVLIDYHLPEMDGYALARLMRELTRSGERVRLVGITSDGHGLASRRGADTLFDAILVKPLEPRHLHATLDRLTRSEEPVPVPPPQGVAHGADALWRRRGLSGRPRAVLLPEPGPNETAAVGQAFDLRGAAEAEIVLIGEAAGLERLRALRAGTSERLLPAFDLTGRLGSACDGTFAVADPESWSALARTLRDFAERRARLAPALLAGDDPESRLLALLFLRDQGIGLPAGSGPAYETGLVRAELMAAVLALAETGALVCEAAGNGVRVELTEAGRRRAVEAAPSPAPALPVVAPPQRAPRWQAPSAVETGRPAAVAHSVPAEPPVAEPTELLNLERIEALRRLIGAPETERLQDCLLTQLETAFPRDLPVAEVGRQAHVLVALAGSLGFDRLSVRCRTLQDAVQTGHAVEPRLAAAREATEQVVALLRLAAERRRLAG